MPRLITGPCWRVGYTGSISFYDDEGNETDEGQSVAYRHCHEREIDAQAEAARLRVYWPKAHVQVDDMQAICARVVELIKKETPAGRYFTHLLRKPLVTGLWVQMEKTIVSIQWHSDAAANVWDNYGLTDKEPTFEVGAWNEGPWFPTDWETKIIWRRDLTEDQGSYETAAEVTLAGLSDIITKLEREK